MTNNILSHVRSLEELHDLIKKDPVSGALEAEKGVVLEVQAAVGKILKDADKVIAQVQAHARSVAEKLTEEAEHTVKTINKNSSKLACELLLDADAAGGASAKENAIKARKILQAAVKTTAELNQRAEQSISMVTEKGEQAASMVKQVAKSSTRDLANAEKAAVDKISKAGRAAAAQLKASPEGKRKAAAVEVLKNLAQAADLVKQKSKEATAHLQEAAAEAIEMVHEAAVRATERVHQSIDIANKKILDVTGVAIEKAVGKKEAAFFDQSNLKEKWGKRGGG